MHALQIPASKHHTCFPGPMATSEICVCFLHRSRRYVSAAVLSCLEDWRHLDHLTLWSYVMNESLLIWYPHTTVFWYDCKHYTHHQGGSIRVIPWPVHLWSTWSTSLCIIFLFIELIGLREGGNREFLRMLLLRVVRLRTIFHFTLFHDATVCNWMGVAKHSMLYFGLGHRWL